MRNAGVTAPARTTRLRRPAETLPLFELVALEESKRGWRGTIAIAGLVDLDVDYVLRHRGRYVGQIFPRGVLTHRSGYLRTFKLDVHFASAIRDRFEDAIAQHAQEAS